MKNYTLLVVDDDPDIVEIITLYLSNANYNVYSASSSTEALEKINMISFDLIILDIMLPDFNGTELCQKIRQSISCPILFISCIDEEEHILHALHIGGDDYIRKPFNPKELVARIQTNLRRVELERSVQPQAPSQLIIKDLIIDLSKYVVYKNQQELLLSPTEFDILMFMINHGNKILHYEEIYRHVWHNESLGDTRTVMVHVSNLRKKLEDQTAEKYIKTIKKRGYMFLI